jgi:Ca2+-binding RTX toxin-like protein
LLQGNHGADGLRANQGRDVLYGGRGADENFGGTGSDLCRSPRTGPHAFGCNR